MTQGSAPPATARAAGAAETPKRRPTRIAVSTYSFWQFKNDGRRDIKTCIDLAAAMGFDAVELLHRQMTDESPAAVQRFKRTVVHFGPR
jgi:L-ribulose-5-phosphate 3-epimerase